MFLQRLVNSRDRARVRLAFYRVNAGTTVKLDGYGALWVGEREESGHKRMTAKGVRRDKAAFSSGCKSHPATTPAGSNRSSYGGNEMAEAFGMRVTIW